MRYLRIKNYDQYQHYGNRNPPWIKLYRCIMNDYELRMAPIASRLAYVYLLIIASETDNRIPYDCAFLSERFGYEVNELTLSPLIDSGFLLASGTRRTLARSTLLLPDLNSLNPDLKIRSKDRAADDLACKVIDFDTFWSAYPRKVGPKAALKAWHAAKDKPCITDILNAIGRAKQSEQWTKDNGQFIPHPATWLNQGRWADQPMTVAPSRPKIPPYPPKNDPIERGRWIRTYGRPQDHGYE